MNELEKARAGWRRRLPAILTDLRTRWSLTVGEPFPLPPKGNAWVAPVLSARHGAAVLKIGFPHFEEQHEMDGLRFWAGDPFVNLLHADDTLHAMLLERCDPGTPLGQIPESEQDTIVAGLLRRLWRCPSEPHSFLPLEKMLAHWKTEAEAIIARASDPGLVREGLNLLDRLSREPHSPVLLATDLHAGNVLRSTREPWLAIDPKPFFGDPAYDATQHLLNGTDRLIANPGQTIERFADLLDLPAERIRLWTFARAAAASVTRDSRKAVQSMRIARALAR